VKPCVGLVVPALEGGGGVPAVARFIKNRLLADGRFDLRLVSLAMSGRDESSVGLLSPSNWRRGVGMRRGQWDGLPFVHVGAAMGEIEFRRYRPRRVLAEAVADCDVLQVVAGSPAWACAVSGLGKPVSIQCATRVKVERRGRRHVAMSPAEVWRRAMTEVVDRMEERALKTADAIQVENRWMYEQTRELNAGRQVDLRYAPPGIDADMFRPLAVRDFATDPYVLCVGRLADPRKNIEMLLDAYVTLPAEIRQRLRVVLAGHDAPSKEFWRHVERLSLRDRVTFIHRPSVDALVRLYQHAAMFGLVSHEEGLGLVVLEAMACGIPVVSTRSGGPDGIITDGEDGFLVPLSDARSLGDQIARLFTDQGLNRAMGLRARATIERRYSQAVAGQAFLDVWEQLTAPTGRLLRCAV
jgi:glycosyltransferase involved in cell wall biosynthesis